MGENSYKAGNTVGQNEAPDMAQVKCHKKKIAYFKTPSSPNPFVITKDDMIRDLLRTPTYYADGMPVTSKTGLPLWDAAGNPAIDPLTSNPFIDDLSSINFEFTGLDGQVPYRYDDVTNAYVDLAGSTASIDNIDVKFDSVVTDNGTDLNLESGSEINVTSQLEQIEIKDGVFEADVCFCQIVGAQPVSENATFTTPLATPAVLALTATPSITTGAAIQSWALIEVIGDGSATLDQSGNLTYTPTGTGAVYIQYQVTDVNGVTSNVALVTGTVTP